MDPSFPSYRRIITRIRFGAIIGCAFFIIMFGCFLRTNDLGVFSAFGSMLLILLAIAVVALVFGSILLLIALAIVIGVGWFVGILCGNGAKGIGIAAGIGSAILMRLGSGILLGLGAGIIFLYWGAMAYGTVTGSLHDLNGLRSPTTDATLPYAAIWAGSGLIGGAIGFVSGIVRYNRDSEHHKLRSSSEPASRGK